MNYKPLKRSVVIAMAAVLIFSLIPQFGGGAAKVSAATTPWVFFDVKGSVNLPQYSMKEISFKSQGTTVTSPAISVVSSNSSVKVYTPTVVPNTTSGGGFTGKVVVKAQKGSGNANLTISVVGNPAIQNDVISVNLNQKINALILGAKQVISKTGSLYALRGKSVTLIPYASGVGSVSSWDYDDEDEEYGYYKDSYEYAISAKSVKWKSSNTKIATVSKTGKVTINKNAPYGKSAKITATYGGASTSCYVYATKKAGSVETLDFVGGRIHTLVAESSTYLDYSATVNGSATSAVKCKSDNTAVATVNASGLVTTKKPGVARITISVGKKSITYTVNVQSPPEFYANL